MSPLINLIIRICTDNISLVSTLFSLLQSNIHKCNSSNSQQSLGLGKKNKQTKKNLSPTLTNQTQSNHTLTHWCVVPLSHQFSPRDWLRKQSRTQQPTASQQQAKKAQHAFHFFFYHTSVKIMDQNWNVPLLHDSSSRVSLLQLLLCHDFFTFLSSGWRSCRVLPLIFSLSHSLLCFFFSLLSFLSGAYCCHPKSRFQKTIFTDWVKILNWFLNFHPGFLAE